MLFKSSDKYQIAVEISELGVAPVDWIEIKRIWATLCYDDETMVTVPRERVLRIIQRPRRLFEEDQRERKE